MAARRYRRSGHRVETVLRGQHGEVARHAVLEQHRHPVGRAVGGGAAGRRLVGERLGRRRGVRRPVAEELVQVGHAGHVRVDDRVVGRHVAGAAEDPEGGHAAASRAAGVGRATGSVRRAAAARPADGRVTAATGRLGAGFATTHRRWATGRDPHECYGNDRRDDDHGSTHCGSLRAPPSPNSGPARWRDPLLSCSPALRPLLRFAH
jgi:hypothetical protein